MNSIKLYADARGVYRAEPADDPTAPDNHSALLETLVSERLDDGDAYVQALFEAGGWRMLLLVPPHAAAGGYESLLPYAVNTIGQFFALGPQEAGWFPYADDRAPGGWYMRLRTVMLPDLSFLDEVTTE